MSEKVAMSVPKIKKAPKYYTSHKQSRFSVKQGIKGFLCTCNFSEKRCIGETYNILHMYESRLYPKVIESNTVQEAGNENAGDIMDELNKEIESIKPESENTITKTFQVLQSGAKNCLFFQTIIDDPVELASYIANDIKESKKQQTKHLLRLIPIEIVCKATINNISEHVAPLLGKHFTTNAKTFGVVLVRRNNKAIDKEKLISKLASMVVNLNPDHKVNLKSPDVVILVEIIRVWCFLSILPDYYKYKKYNLYELSFTDRVVNTEKPNVVTDQ